MNQTQLQLYSGAKDNTGEQITLNQAIEMVTGTKLKVTTEVYHTMQPGTQKDEYKKTKFPAVTWSGIFKKRNARLLIKHSSLIAIDIDKLTPEKHDSLKKLLRYDDYIFFMFTSPSGVGLKLILKIPINENEPIATQQLSAFLSISQYLQQEYGIATDASGKDVCRLCFLCFDSDAYYNPAANLFAVSPVSAAADTIKTPVSKPLNKKQQQQLSVTELTANDVFEFTQNISNYSEGNRNNFLHLYANNCNRRGIAEKECLQFALQFASDQKESDIKATVASAYKNTNDYAKFAKKNKVQLPANSSKMARKNDADNQHATNRKADASATLQSHTEENNSNADFIQFWYITEKTDKETGEKIRTYKVDYLKFREFLVHQGYAKYRLEKGYQFIRTIGNKVEVVETDDIRSFIIDDFLYKREFFEVYKMIVQGNKTYLGDDKLKILPFTKINIKRDDSKTSYFYFNNCIVHVTADKITTHSYDELDQHIWAQQVKDHDFTLQTFSYSEQLHYNTYPNWPCEFAQFIYLTSWNPNNEQEKGLNEAERIQRFEAFCTSIGYLLDGYKHPAYRKGIFSIDHRVSEKRQSNGRSGKSLISVACSHLKVVSTISGGTYDPRYQFRFEPINIDTQIVNFNDLKDNVDIRELFEIIADNYPVNKRHTGNIIFKYSDSGKVYVSMNGLPKGDGDSYKARSHVIEFSDYFNANNTPYDHFGHNFFDDWSKEQWNHFYNYLLWCVMLYKRKGLVAYPNGNFNARKLKNSCPDEFIEYLDAQQTDLEDVPNGTYINIKRNSWENDREDFMIKWNTEALKLGMNRFASKSVTNMIEIYCRAKELFFLTKTANSKTHFWIGDRLPAPITPTMKLIVQGAEKNKTQLKLIDN